jgi:hypothetical protein
MGARAFQGRTFGHATAATTATASSYTQAPDIQRGVPVLAGTCSGRAALDRETGTEARWTRTSANSLTVSWIVR